MLALAAAPATLCAQAGHGETPAALGAPEPTASWQAAPSEAGQAEAEHVAPAAGGHAQGAGPHHESIWGPISRLVNFLILAGALVYFFRAPFRQYLADRHAQVRADLEAASEMTRAAAAQMASVEERLKVLPADLEVLKSRGAQEIAAEEQRITAAASADRERLVEQTRREIDMQLRAAHRDLVEHAAALAVSLATDQVKATITPADQVRLVDRYVEQVKK